MTPTAYLLYGTAGANRIGLFVSILVASMLFSPVISAAEFFVATDGDDRWSGTLPVPNRIRNDGPFATPSKAVEAAHKAPDAMGNNIHIAAGRYYLLKPIFLDSKDSGLTIESADGAAVTLCGGRPIDNWRKAAGGLWSAVLPKTGSAEWSFRIFVVGDQYRHRARLPATGFYDSTNEWNEAWRGTTSGGWMQKPSGTELTSLSYKTGDISTDLDIINAELTIYHSWNVSLERVVENDTKRNLLTLASPAQYPPGAFGNHHYVIHNIRGGMTKPGQWYLDRNTRTIFYWPIPGEKAGNLDAIAPTIDTLLVMAGENKAPIRRITLKGLRFSVTDNPITASAFGAATDSGAISITNASDIDLLNLQITNVGGYAIKAKNTSHLRIEKSDIHHTGGGGIMIEGSDSVVANTRIHDVGLLDPSAIALWSSSNDNRRLLFQDNDIENTSYSAIVASGNENHIQRNRVAHAVTELNDGAGIYLSYSHGTSVLNNLVTDIGALQSLGFAYYVDEQSTDNMLEDNRSIRTRGGLQLHMTDGSVVRNNLFENGTDLIVNVIKSDHALVENNVFVAGASLRFSEALSNTTIRHNVMFSSSSEYADEKRDASGSWSGLKQLEMNDNTFANPQLRNGPDSHARFEPDSPVIRLGIHPIDAGPANSAH